MAVCEIPIEISDPEEIARIIISPYHIRDNKSSPKPAAFRSRAGTDDVSVVRSTHMGLDFCKSKGCEIVKNRNGQYAGLVTLHANAIRAVGSSVTDSREEFCGHAHISHGIISRVDEPQESATNLRITERCRELLKLATYHPNT